MGRRFRRLRRFSSWGWRVLVLREKVGLFRWGAATLGFIGAMVIIQPGASSFSWGSLCILVGAMMFAAFSISTRILGRSDSVSTTFFYTGMVGAIGISLIVPFYWEVPQVVHLPWILVIGLFGAAGQGLLIVALKFAAPQVIAPLLYVQLIWAGGIGFVTFGDVPGTNALIGAAIIVAAGLIVQWRERHVARSKLSGDS
jgi:drug/metabolite transporter (DMT)-like permease